MLLGRLSQPVGGGARLHIVRSNLKVKVMSKSVDFPYTPGDGYKQCHSCRLSLAPFSCVSTVGSLSVMGREVGGQKESNFSLRSVSPPRISSLVNRRKLAFPFVDRKASSEAMELDYTATQCLQNILALNS